MVNLVGRHLSRPAQDHGHAYPSFEYIELVVLQRFIIGEISRMRGVSFGTLATPVVIEKDHNVVFDNAMSIQTFQHTNRSGNIGIGEKDTFIGQSINV